MAAGFGGLGGLGGFSPSYPTRFGVPISRQVQSLDELTMPLRQEFEQARDADYDARLAARGDLWDAHTSRIGADLSGLTPAQRYKSMDDFFKGGTFAAQTGRDEFLGHVFGGDKDRIGAFTHAVTSEGPDYQEYQRRLQEITQPYMDAQTRNQQAYGQMTGGGQLNAMMGPDYANANFGSITGQGPAQIPAVGGVSMDWASGVYDPSQASGMFGNTGRARTQGGWL